MLTLRALFLSAMMASMSVAAPTIGNLSLRGLQAGGTTSLVIDGAELGPNTSLLTAAPGVTAQIKPSSTPQRIEADVTVDAQTPPGIYLLRIASAAGVSNAVPIGIDQLPQAPFTPQLTALPIALSGDLTGSSVLNTSFTGKKGQRIVVEVESRRLGGKLKPVVRLLDARRTQIAWGKPMPVIAGDTRCEANLPADGQYTIELNDLVFRGEGPGMFRLKIGDLHYADFAFPLGVERGKSTTLEFLSTSFPAGTNVAATIATAGDEPSPWPTGLQLLTGSRPRLTVRSHAELSELRTEDKPQELPSAPVAVSGKLAKRGEHDIYRLPVTPGQALRFEVFAHRLGSPIDATLTVMNEQLGALASNDDLPGTKDAALDFTIPPDAKALLIGVRDMLNLGDPLGVYRLQVTAAGAPDFSLSLAEEAKQAPAGGTAVLLVRAERRGYNGPIKLSLPGLAGGIAVTGAEIAAGSNDALVSIAAPATGAASSLVSVIGESVDTQPPIIRTALVPDGPQFKSQPWLRTEVAIGIAPPAPLTVAWDLPSGDGSLAIGSRVPVHVKVERAAGVTGAVRLVLQTTQIMPKKFIPENNQPKEVDAPERMLRLDGTPTIAADQTEIAASAVVPYDLPPMTYDSVVRAELLAADNTAVVATVFAPVRRLQVVKSAAEQPLAIFEDQPEVAAALKEGGGQIAVHEAEKYSGKASLRVTPDQKFTASLPGLAAKIRENPAPGEYRYIRFAWKKNAGEIALQIAHDGQFGPKDNKPPSFRYQAGSGAEFGGMALRVDARRPQNFEVVTRDLFADFGEFTLTGLALAAIDGEFALFDHIYLGRTPADFDLVKP